MNYRHLSSKAQVGECGGIYSNNHGWIGEKTSVSWKKVWAAGVL